MPSVRDLADGLLGACLDFESGGPYVDQLEVTVELLLESGGGEVYTAFEGRADDLLDAFPSRGEANLFVVRFWLQAPSSDWGKWHDQLRANSGPVPAEFLDPLVDRLLAESPGLEDDQQDALPAQLATLVSLHEPIEEGEDLPGVGPAGAALASAAWWVDGEGIATERRLHTAVRELRNLGPPVESEVNELLAADLVRALQAAPADEAVGDAVVELASEMSETTVRRIAAEIPAADFAADPTSAASLVLLRVRMAEHLRRTGSSLWEEEPFLVGREVAEQAIGSELPAADQAIQTWLGLKPQRADVVRVLRVARDRSPRPRLREALAAWAQDAPRKDRTKLTRTLIGWPHDTSPWIQVVASPGVAEKELIDLFKSKMDQAANHDSRLLMARKARALRPQGNAGQRQLADLIIWLLAPDRPKGDIAVATTVLEGLGTGHQSGRRLSTAFREATNRHKQKLKGDQIAALRAARIDVPQKWIGKKLLEKFFG